MERLPEFACADATGDALEDSEVPPLMECFVRLGQ